jgi:hypothetical protein
VGYDFERLKAIPIDAVLGFYNIPVYKRSDTELVADCPLPSHVESSKEHQRTFAIGLQKKKWFCHWTNCQKIGNHRGGDVIDLVARLEHCDTKTAAKILSERFLQGNGEGGRRELKSAAKPEPEATGNKPLAFELKHLDPDHPEILKKISLETAIEFGIGFHSGKGSMANRICFPLRENGSLVGYAGRAVNPEEEPRWKFPAGLIKSFLYALERADPAKPLILCESCWGPPWFYQHGAQAAAMLGSSLTEAQERLLEPFHTIHLAMDNDEAGRAAAEKIAQRLKVNHKVFRAYLNE